MQLNPRIYKLVCSICLLLSTSALVMIARAPSSGYEVSIYTSNLPPLVWVLLITSMGGSIFLLVGQALGKESQENNWWLIPLFTLMFSSLIVLLLPILRGYLMYSREDGLQHLGYIKDTISSGHFADYNYYPVLHVFSTALAITTGLSSEGLILYILPIFSLCYMLTIYFLAKNVFYSRGQIILAATLGTILIFPHYGLLSGTNPPALMFPLLLALFIRVLWKKSLSYTLLFILVMLLVPYSHPMATLVLMITLVTAYLMLALANNRFRVQQTIPFNFFFILAIISFLWYADFFIFNRAVDWVVNIISLEIGISPIPKITTELERVAIHGFDIITLAFKIYGGEIISVALALIGTVLIAKRFTFEKYADVRESILVGSLFVVFGLIYLAYYAGLGFGQGGVYSRFIFYLPIVSIIPASFALYEFVHRYGYMKLVNMLAVCLILTAAILSIFNRYTSPYRYQPNAQVTRMEIAGTRWIITNRHVATKITYIATALYRYTAGIYGDNFVRQNSIDPGFPHRYTDLPSPWPIPVPDHFNYQNHETIGESFGESGYMMLSEYDRLLYQHAWERVGRFNQKDFDKLEHDPTADKLYSNGEFDIWYIQHAL